MLPLILIAMTFWGADALAQIDNDFSIVIAPPARASQKTPALIDARYFSGRFIFYFNEKVKAAKWNSEGQKLAPLEEGAAVVVHAGPLTRKYPLKNELEVSGAKGKRKKYTITFVPMYTRRAPFRPVGAGSGNPGREVTSATGSEPIASSTLALRSERSPLRLGSFEALAFVSVPRDGNTAFAPLGAWTPQWHLTYDLTLNLRVGFSPMKTMSRGFFVATEYLTEMGFRRDHWYGYLGGGVQIWHQRLGVNPVGTLGVRYYHARMRDRSQAWLMIAYSAYLPTNDWVHQLRFGMGFEI